MKSLISGQLVKLTYTNDKQETSNRVVIPTLIPKQNVTTIDVTALTEKEQLEMSRLYQEYAEYYRNFMSNAFNFETWVEHTTSQSIAPKWRALKLANIEVEVE